VDDSQRVLYTSRLEWVRGSQSEGISCRMLSSSQSCCNGLLDNLWCRKSIGPLPLTPLLPHEWYSPGCCLRCSATCASGIFQSEDQQGTLRATRLAMSVRHRQAGAHRDDKGGRCYHQGTHIRARAVCVCRIFYLLTQRALIE
jgi:hypothetical protein